MKIGYARVSSGDQSLDLQFDALNKAGCKKIFDDRASGKKAPRPGLDKLLESAREGDVIVVWRLDRLGRSLQDLIWVVNKLESDGIGFTSLEEKIDTTSSGGKLVFHIFGALAEFEGALIRERTQAGLAAARARGKLGGRPRVLDTNQQKLLFKLYNSGEHSLSEICKILKISKPTIYNYLETAKR